MKPSRRYEKSAAAKATVGESMALSQQAAYPAIVGARFAVILSVLALVVASVALVAAWVR